MRKTLLMTTGLAWLALTGAASAGVVVVSLAPGPLDPQWFVGHAAGDNNFTDKGITWTLVSGQAGVAVGTTPNISAAPLGMGTSTTTGTPYMAVEGGGTEMATLSHPLTSLDIYWGSIDGTVGGNLNSFSITVDNYTLTGADLVAMGASGTGSQTDPAANQEVSITGLAAYSQITFTSTQNAFEFSVFPNGSPFTPGTPEPSTWAMMMLGFAGLGYAAFRRNVKGRALAI
jgi:hypothetical protein